MEFQKLLTNISERYSQILGENLIGIYVHGSIAFGCFNWERSDIDFLVVIDESLSHDVKQRLLQVLEDLRNLSPPNGFEMSAVLREHCKNFIHPTPYELHFSNNSPDDYNINHNKDFDLAAHFTIIKSAGIVLYGEPIDRVFGAIPKSDYLDSICKDIENAREDVAHNPTYIILNLCRVYAFIKDELVLSKEQGGQWGLVNLPIRYHSLITSMLNNYVSGDVFIKDEAMQKDFCDYMINLIYHT